MLTELIELPAGSFVMGSTDFYLEEAPVRTVSVSDFAIDRHPVTNAQFGEFVARTGYVTIAEKKPDPVVYPDVHPDDLTPGALVFRPTSGPVDLRDWRQWWEWVPYANWRRPFGPGSDIADKADHPVVQVAYADAAAYARWADRRLPTEAEWEYAAHAGTATTYPWGEEATPGGRLMANTWQGRFPYHNDGADGWIGTSPVGSFPPNGFGLVDMIGNVWEWTSTRYLPHHQGFAGFYSMLWTEHGSGRQPDPQRRLAPLCTAVLPSLPARRAFAAIAGQRDHPYRVSLRRRSQLRPP